MIPRHGQLTQKQAPCRSCLYWTMGVHDKCATKRSALNFAQHLVVSRSTGHRWASVLHHMSPKCVVAGDLKFKSNPCNHNGIAGTIFHSGTRLSNAPSDSRITFQCIVFVSVYCPACTSLIELIEFSHKLLQKIQPVFTR